MRSVLALVAALGLAGWVAITHLPAGEAVAAAGGMRLSAPVQQIQSIAIDGGRGLPLASLRAVLSTRIGAQVDKARLAADRGALEAELAASGFLAAKVEAPVVTFGTTGGAYITFPVTPGAVFKIRSVTLSGATEKDAGVVTLSSGDEAVADRIERARARVVENLARRGKTKAIVTANVTTDVAERAVDVELAVR